GPARRRGRRRPVDDCARRRRWPAHALCPRRCPARVAVVMEPLRIERLVGVSLDPAIDKIAMVERLELGSIHRPELLAAVPGGKALNAVRVARTLGAVADVVAVVAGHAGAWV